MSGATELVFVSAFHNLPGVSDGEWVDYYAPHEMQRLRWDLRTYIEHQLDFFSKYSEYAEYFSVADYGDPGDSLNNVEEAAFRSALGRADKDTELKELHPLDVLHGFRAVILQRVASGDMAEIRSAVDLFDWIVEGAIEAVDERNPRSCIRIETAAEFGPRFIDGLLGSVESLKQTWRYDGYDRFIGEKFAPLKPLLDLLHTLVHHEGWPRNDLAIGELLLIVYYFKRVVAEEWQS